MSAKTTSAETKTESPQKPGAASGALPEGLEPQAFARNMLTVGMKSQQLLMDFAARMARREGPARSIRSTFPAR